MGDRIYKLTEIEFMPNECPIEEFDNKEKEQPTITYEPSTPSIRSEEILSVRERAELHFKNIESKEVSKIKILFFFENS
jgi:hypothetical protein